MIMPPFDIVLNKLKTMRKEKEKFCLSGFIERGDNHWITGAYAGSKLFDGIITGAT